MLGTLFFANTESTNPHAQKYAGYIKTAYTAQTPQEVDEHLTTAAMEITLAYFHGEFKADNINTMQTYLSGPFKFMYWVPPNIDYADDDSQIPQYAIRVELKDEKLHFQSNTSTRIMTPSYREELSAMYYSNTSTATTVLFEERKVTTFYMRFEQSDGPNHITLEQNEPTAPVVITLNIYNDCKKEMYECKHTPIRSTFSVKLGMCKKDVGIQQLMQEKLATSGIKQPCDLCSQQAVNAYIASVVSAAAEKTKDFPLPTMELLGFV